MSSDACVQALRQAQEAVATERPAKAADELQRIKSKLDALISEAEAVNAVHGLGDVRPERMR